MNNRNNRATRAIATSVSLIVIIVFAVPWVDEYLQLRGDAAQLTELQDRSAELSERDRQLDRIEAKLTSNLDNLSARSVDPSKTEQVRETIVEIVRHAGGRIRRLEIPSGERRRWAIENDTVTSSTMPIYGEESEFELHTHTVELQVEGSLKAIQATLRGITDQGWLMTTKGLNIRPTSVRESPVSFELQLVLYGLAPREQEPEEDYAHRPNESNMR